MSRTARRTLGGAVFALLVLLLAACSSSASKSSSSSVPAGASSSASNTIDPAIAKQFSGLSGTSAATGTPITVGLIGQEGGTISDPEFRVAAQAAASYINEELGGVGGHPITFEVCNIVSAESQGQVCAQQFLGDNKVKVILQGGLNVGTQSFHATVNGAKPDIIAEANPGPDTTAKNAYILNASVVAATASTGPWMKDYLKAKTAAMISSDDAGSLAIAHVIGGAVEQSGVKVKLVTFPAGSSDLVTPLTAAGAQTASVIMPLAVTPSACIATAKAYSQLGLQTPLLSANLCASNAIKSALGDFPKWYYGGSTLSLDAPDSTGQVAFYKAVMAKYAPAHAELSVDAPYGFAAVFALANILHSADPDSLTSASIATAAKAFSGPVLMGSPKLSFGSVPSMPAVGSLASRFYKYNGGGAWSSAGDWVNVPS